MAEVERADGGGEVAEALAGGDKGIIAVSVGADGDGDVCRGKSSWAWLGDEGLEVADDDEQVEGQGESEGEGEVATRSRSAEWCWQGRALLR